MTKFSANLGFLWTDLPLAEAILAARTAGFDAVELHWPYNTPADEVVAALREMALPLMGLNTRRGNTQGGENGLSALPGRTREAREAIDEALDYAATTGAGAVHVMAGFAQGVPAEVCFVDNLKYACAQAAAHDITILIEPLNHFDAPGYFLSTTKHAEEIITRVEADNLKLMFDCYHVQRMEGDLCTKLERLLPLIGHIQFARVPDRGPPEGGEINYSHVFDWLKTLGWDKPIGAEYKSDLRTGDTLGWMSELRG